jgi:exopolysaccharide production protein ExoZ
MRQIVSIQYLRGIAALLVVFYHSAESLVGVPLDGAVHALAWGASGVDIFFVISGFIMWSSTAHRPLGVAAFWKARATRIVPLYWIFTFIYLIWLAARSPNSVTFDYGEIIKSLFFVPFTNSFAGTSVPIVGAGWTLNYEALTRSAFASPARSFLSSSRA